MKTLVVHPLDSSTDFLCPIYESIAHKTVIREGITKTDVARLIENHDTVMMMGHGTLYGLLSAGQFPESDLYIIDNDMAPLLKKKENNIYIWCNADEFVEYHNLSGFYSGMFVSEVSEALMMGLSEIDQSMVDDSNRSFSLIAGEHINENSEVLWKNIKNEYGRLTENPVACYNHQRLYYKLHK